MVIKTEPAFTWLYSCNKLFVGNAPQYCLHGMWATTPAPPVGAHCSILNSFAPKKAYRWLTNMKRCSTSVIIREMLIKTTRRYHLALVRLTAVQKSTSHKCWRRCREGNPLALLVGMQTSTATMENTVEIP